MHWHRIPQNFDLWHKKRQPTEKCADNAKVFTSNVANNKI